jgi:hypothetical protein
VDVPKFPLRVDIRMWAKAREHRRIGRRCYPRCYPRGDGWASGQLEQLAASFAWLDPPPVGNPPPRGAAALVAQYLDRLGLVKVIDTAARCAVARCWVMETRSSMRTST